MVSSFMYFLFFVNKFFKNLAYVDICCIASKRGILICNCLKISMNRANCLSLSFLDGTRGYGSIFSIFSSFLFSIFSSSFSFSIFFPFYSHSLYDASILHLRSRIRHVFVSDTLGYFIVIYQ